MDYRRGNGVRRRNLPAITRLGSLPANRGIRRVRLPGGKRLIRIGRLDGLGVAGRPHHRKTASAAANGMKGKTRQRLRVFDWHKLLIRALIVFCLIINDGPIYSGH